MKQNMVSHGFRVIDCFPLPELNAEGVWLVHEQTGMEVFHVQCDDEENLFSFAFKTPPEDSSGVAHILEHSVLCGSEHFPLKDPFLQLSNQSIKTFLNAMTFPDKTVYPASSMSEADYFNLMAVYGDAVFFPLLAEWTFNQEAHHLEFDENGSPCIQGVVYNEMKGNYSSFEGIASDWTIRSLLTGTAYEVDSGGDPACIPLLTYEQFKAFHKRYYHPSNCRLFLYGNISLEKQLAFIDEHFMQAFASDTACKAASCKSEASPITTGILKPFAEPRTVTVSAPASSDEKGATVLLNWVVGRGDDPVEAMEAQFLSEILLGHDGSPLSRALVECGLGEDISPSTGIESELQYVCFSAGLRGMKAEDASALEKVIFGVLESLCKDGIPPEEIEAAVMSADFSNREIKRGHGPFSLVLMRRALKGWLHGKNPAETLINSRAFDVVKARLCADSSYVKKLIQKLLLSNAHRTTLIVVPDAHYDEQAASVTANIIAEKLKHTNEDEIKRKKDELTAIQQKKEDASVLALIPHLKPADLSDSVDTITTVRGQCGGSPLFTHTEVTNGIVYLDVAVPVDVLAPEDYRFLPFLSTAITCVGFGGRDWGDAAALCARTAGGLGAALFVSSASPALSACEYEEKKKNDPAFERTWMIFRIKMLEEKTEDAVNLLFSCLQTADFTDTNRIKDLLVEYRNDCIASVAPGGNQYAASRVSRSFSRAKVIDEIWNGLTQIYDVQRFVQMETATFAAELSRLRDTLIHSGCVINITAMESGIARTRAALEAHSDFLCAPVSPCKVADEAFVSLTEIQPLESAQSAQLSVKAAPKEQSNADSVFLEYFAAPLQVGFAAAAVPASLFGSKEAVYEALLGHWLTNSFLWEQIRTVGGAYGAFAFPDSLEGVFAMATYRDPQPERSLSVFTECLQNIASAEFDDDTIEKAITGTYSREVQPRSPAGRGFTGFVRALYGIRDEDRIKKMHILLSATPSDIKSCAKKLSAVCKNMQKTIISAKKDNYTGKTIDLPL